MKFFAWAGESEQQDIMKSLGYTPVPLETSDILPSIQTGMITAVPATPYFALASQITPPPATHARHQLGAHRRRPGGHPKELGRMSPPPATPEGRRHRAGLQMRTQARKEVDEGRRRHEEARPAGAHPDPEQMKEWNTLAEQLCPRIRGRMVPADTFDEVVRLLRTTAPASAEPGHRQTGEAPRATPRCRGQGAPADSPMPAVPPCEPARPPAFILGVPRMNSRPGASPHHPQPARPSPQCAASPSTKPSPGGPWRWR